MRGVLVVIALGLWPIHASAHAPSDAHLRLSFADDRIDGRLDIAVSDLDTALVIDADGDGAVTWGELQAASPRIDRYITERLRFGTEGRTCDVATGIPALAERSAGPHWSVPLSGRCDASIARITITYSLLFDADILHRALVRVELPSQRLLVIRNADPVELTVGLQTSALDFIVEGIWHIWHGLDHILFLTCLLLPVVYTPRGTQPRSLRDIGISVLQIVTAFTVSHSLTLALSAFDVVRLPTRLVETGIALSVVVVAVNNLLRTVDARWGIAFALGLLHGFGFSGVLVDLGLPTHELVLALFGFNAGVELGQLAFVLVLLPLLYVIRNTFAYRALLWSGSVAIALLATFWTYQRWFL